MKILSLFDGISCARVALDRAGLKVDAYYASEIDKYAIQISQKNYPDIKQMGDIKGLCSEEGLRRWLPDIDLMIGGSPCQDLSIAKKDRKGLSGERSGLFWNYVLLLKYVKPKYFILENVNSMPKEAKDLITKTLGVEPIMINASLVSAQNRKRLFWTNILNVTQPEDKNIFLKDILEINIEEKYNVSLKHTQAMINTRKSKKLNIPNEDGKCGTLTASYYKIPNDGNYIKLNEQNTLTDSIVRKLTPIECERLQGLPDNYTEGISNTQRYKCLGNAFNVGVVAHILSFIPKNQSNPH